MCSIVSTVTAEGDGVQQIPFQGKSVYSEHISNQQQNLTWTAP